ncbi:hypothetical protein D3C72_2171200 [compost metagenome]
MSIHLVTNCRNLTCSITTELIKNALSNQAQDDNHPGLDCFQLAIKKRTEDILVYIYPSNNKEQNDQYTYINTTGNCIFFKRPETPQESNDYPDIE